jgi:hypothetical protein
VRPLNGLPVPDDRSIVQDVLLATRDPSLAGRATTEHTIRRPTHEDPSAAPAVAARGNRRWPCIEKAFAIDFHE